MGRAMKTIVFNFRIDPKLLAAARKAADLDQRSLSGLITKLLTQYCKRVGTLK
jgi:hypothetical protein